MAHITSKMPALVLLAILLTPGIAAGQTSYVWSNALGGNWATNANWSPSTGHPGAGLPGMDNATITLGGTYNITVDSGFDINNLTLNNAGTTLISTGSFTVAGTATLTAGTVSGSIGWGGTGTLINNSTINVTSSNANYSITTFQQNGNMNVIGSASSSTLTFAKSYTNDGFINLTSTGGGTATLAITLPMTLTNSATGTITTIATAFGGRSIAGNLSNAGTVNINHNTGFTVISSSLTNSNVFTIASGVTFTMTAGTQSLTLSSGSFSNSGTFNMTSGTVNYNGGTSSGTFNMLNSTLANGVAAGNGTFSFTNSGNEFSGTVPADQALIVQGSASTSTLTTIGSLTNNGSITLQTTGGGLAQLISGANTLTNAGTITLAAGGGGGGLNLNGNITNSGTIAIDQSGAFNGSGRTLTNTGDITIATGKTLTMTTGSQILNLNDGSFSNSGTFNMTSGTINYNGGTTSGTLNLLSSTLANGVAAGNGTFSFTGSSNEFSGTVPADQSLIVQGSASTATLTTIGSLTNNGSITLQTSGGGLAQLVSAGNTLTNAGTITLAEGGGGGGLNLNGNFSNSGTIAINQSGAFNGASRTLTNTGDITIATGKTFTMIAGSQVLNLDNGSFSNSGTFNMTSGTINYNGGTTSGTLNLLGSTLNNGVAAGNGTFSFTSSSNEFSGTVPADQALIVQGTASSSTLTTVGSLTNNGNITMQTSGGGLAQLISGANTLTNAGTITLAAGGGGGGLNLNGNFTNSGTIAVNESGSFSGASRTLTNTGAVTIAAGKTFTMIAGSQIFNQNSGTLTVTGDFTMTSGTFNFNNGTITGTPLLTNSDLAITATTAGQFIQRGTSSGLTGAIAAGQMLTIEATTSSTTVTATTNIANAGTISITNSTSAGPAAFTITSPSNLTNSATGIITVDIGTGGTRTLSLELKNSGAITFFKSASLGRASAVHANSGTFTVNGSGSTVTLSGTSFTNTGTVNGNGTISTPFAISNDGIVAPGLSAGILSITGAYTQTGGGSLAIEIGGTVVGTDYDRLAITGTATLAGTLGLTLISGFTPLSTDTFTILTSASTSGAFANAPGGGIVTFPDGQFSVSYTGGSVILSNFVPIPEPTWMLAAVMLMLMVARTRKL